MTPGGVAGASYQPVVAHSTRFASRMIVLQVQNFSSLYSPRSSVMQSSL